MSYGWTKKLKRGSVNNGYLDFFFQYKLIFTWFVITLSANYRGLAINSSWLLSTVRGGEKKSTQLNNLNSITSQNVLSFASINCKALWDRIWSFCFLHSPFTSASKGNWDVHMEHILLLWGDGNKPQNKKCKRFVQGKDVQTFKYRKKCLFFPSLTVELIK